MLTEFEQQEITLVLNELLADADGLAQAGQVRVSGTLLTARQTIRLLLTKLMPPKPTPAETPPAPEPQPEPERRRRSRRPKSTADGA